MDQYDLNHPRHLMHTTKAGAISASVQPQRRSDVVPLSDSRRHDSAVDLTCTPKMTTTPLSDTISNMAASEVTNSSNSLGLSTSAAPKLIILDDDQKHTYRMRDIELVATNNPYALCRVSIDPVTHWPPRRVTGMCDNNDFVQCWKSHLLAPVTAFLKDLPSGWLLDVVRSGFTVNDQLDTLAYPIVLHLLFIQGSHISDKRAGEIVQGLAHIISSKWQGEKVYIEICKPHPRAAKQASSPFDMSSACGSIYSRILPFPGSSIGQMVDEVSCISGTLTGYIRHKDAFYALTCSHVLPSEINNEAHSPSPIDRRAITSVIRKHLKRLLPTSRLQRIRDRVTKLFSRFPLPVGFWEMVSDASKNWVTKLGDVKARSEFSKPKGFDWCIIEVDESKAKKVLHLNQHTPRNDLEINSGFRHPVIGCFTAERVVAAEEYFKDGPPFKSVRTTELERFEICLKPPSRTTQDWVVAYRNPIDNVTQSGPGEVPFPQHVLICPPFERQKVVSAEGDSGSIILDKNFQPVMMVTSGEVLRGLDVTYATHLHSVLRDIEGRTHWDAGSVSFC